VTTSETGSVSTTHAAALAADPRVGEARGLLAAALAEHRGGLDRVRPAQEAAHTAYTELIERFAALRGNPLWYRYLGSGLGNGAYVELADGSVKIDLISGIGVHAAGHSSDLLWDAALDAALSDLPLQGHLQQNAVGVDVSRLLLELAQPSAVEHVLLCTTGAMANDNAFKIAFQHRAPADRVLAFARGFAGRSLGMASVTDKPAFRDGVPCTLAVDYLPFFDPADPAGSQAAALARLDEHLARHPDRHALMIAEPIQGEGGYIVPEAEFLHAVFARAREHGVLILADEIQSFARTTRPFAIHHFGLHEHVDLITVGKTAQICATLFSDRVAPRPGLISQTYTGATGQLHAARAILGALSAPELWGEAGRVMATGDQLRARLEAIAAAHPRLLAGPYGIGSMVACTPYGGDRARVLDLAKRLFDTGVIGFVAGSAPTRLRFLPPVLADCTAAIDEAAAILTEVLVGGADG